MKHSGQRYTEHRQRMIERRAKQNLRTRVMSGADQAAVLFWRRWHRGLESYAKYRAAR